MYVVIALLAFPAFGSLSGSALQFYFDVNFSYSMNGTFNCGKLLFLVHKSHFSAVRIEDFL